MTTAATRALARAAFAWGVVLLTGAGGAVALAGPAGSVGGDFIYVVEPGDTLIGLATRFMASAEGWRLLQQRNHVPDPYHLQPGSRIRIPLSQIPEQAATATVVYSRGQVRANGAPLQAGTKLAEAARIETGADASVTLELPDRTRVTLPPSTNVEVRRLRAFSGSGLTDTVIGIDRGGADSSVAPHGGGVGRFEMRTPMMVTGVRGTRYRVSADTSGSRSEVLEGKVGVGAGRGNTTTAATVTAGFGVAASADGKLSRPIAMLPSPVLEPLPQEVVGSSVTVAWRPVPAAAGYQVAVARDAALTELVWTGHADSPSATPAGLPEGQLYLAVSAVAANRITGHAAVAPFEVRLNPPAPFTLQPTDGGTRYGQPTGFEWGTVDTAAAYELSVAADAGFTRGVDGARVTEPRAGRELAPGRWWWRVRSVDGKGRSGPWSEPVAFAVEPAPPTPGMDDAGDALRIRWSGDAPGQMAPGGYRVQLASDAAFASLVVDERTTANEIRLERPPAGIYFVRIARARPDGTVDEAAFSLPQRIEIASYLRDAQGGAVNIGGGGSGGIRLQRPD